MTLMEILDRCWSDPKYGCLEFLDEDGNRTDKRGPTRELWTAVNGPIPQGMLVLHHCDNPACVNIDHMYLGTPRDNVLDMLRRGRHHSRNPQRLEANRLRKLRAKEARERDRLRRRTLVYYIYQFDWSNLGGKQYIGMTTDIWASYRKHSKRIKAFKLFGAPDINILYASTSKGRAKIQLFHELHSRGENDLYGESIDYVPGPLVRHVGWA